MLGWYQARILDGLSLFPCTGEEWPSRPLLAPSRLSLSCGRHGHMTDYDISLPSTLDWDFQRSAGFSFSTATFSHVRLSGWLSPEVSMDMGLAQGWPLPGLFVKAVQPLAAHLRQQAQLDLFCPIRRPDGTPLPLRTSMWTTPRDMSRLLERGNMSGLDSPSKKPSCPSCLLCPRASGFLLMLSIVWPFRLGRQQRSSRV